MAVDSEYNLAGKSYTELDPNNIPQHIAVIMDGNGRWARRRGKERLEGHFQGYRALKKLVMAASDLGVKAVTAYAFSSENWTRPDEEVSGLMKLMALAARMELEYMKNEGVKIITSGRYSELPKLVQDQFNEDYEETKNNDRITLNIALNYGGRNEIIDAARAAAGRVASGEIEVNDIDEALISSNMYHPELPDLDLVIRTAGEMRISNFLLWEAAYSEFYCTKVLWPDFNKRELMKAIANYQKRTRKFGAVVE